jgi:hypothetical protein
VIKKVNWKRHGQQSACARAAVCRPALGTYDTVATRVKAGEGQRSEKLLQPPRMCGEDPSNDSRAVQRRVRTSWYTRKQAAG